MRFYLAIGGKSYEVEEEVMGHINKLDRYIKVLTDKIRELKRLTSTLEEPES